MRRRKLSKAQRLKVYNLFSGRCAYCGKTIAYEYMQVDHVVPLHNGGADNESNYFPACRMCNYYKSTLTLDKFRAELRKLQERLRKDFTYRLALRYGLIRGTKNEVTFYFEQKQDREADFAVGLIKKKIENG